jgi:hypothetical protein
MRMMRVRHGNLETPSGSSMPKSPSHQISCKSALSVLPCNDDDEDEGTHVRAQRGVAPIGDTSKPLYPSVNPSVNCLRDRQACPPSLRTSTQRRDRYIPPRKSSSQPCPRPISRNGPALPWHLPSSALRRCASTQTPSSSLVTVDGPLERETTGCSTQTSLCSFMRILSMVMLLRLRC